jgi:hypothetical protein
MEDIFEGLKKQKFVLDEESMIEQRDLFVMDALKRNATIIECPHCTVTGNEPNMLRWHFENCDTKLRCCEQCGNTIPRQGIKPFLYDVKKYCNRKCYTESKKGKPPIVMTDEVKQKISKIALTQSKERSERMKKTRPWDVKWKKNT